MDAVSYKTISANKDIVKKEWVLIDAQEMVVGRLATVVARILKGKTKPYYTPSFDCGDNVIIINAEKVRFSGKKCAAVAHEDPGGLLIGVAAVLEFQFSHGNSLRFSFVLGIADCHISDIGHWLAMTVLGERSVNLPGVY